MMIGRSETGVTGDGMRRLVLRIGAIVLILVGLVVWPLPIPFGLPMVAVGLTIFVANSVWAASKVRAARQRWPRFNVGMRKTGRSLPRSIYRILASTDPRRRPQEARS